MIERVKFAVVGLGGFGRTHLAGVADVEGAGLGKLDAVVCIDPENHVDTLVELRARGVRFFDDVDSLLAAGGMDVVTLPIGIHHHVPLSIACVEAGFNVIVEKPLTAVVQEADRLIAARDRTGKAVIVGYQFLYSDTIQGLKERALDGRFGRVESISVHAGWPRGDVYYARNGWAGRLQLDGAWVLDSPINNALSHQVTNALYLCGETLESASNVRSVQAELYRAREIESLDTASLRAVTESGVTVHIAMSHVNRERFGPDIVVHCEKATVEWGIGSARIDYSDGTTETIEDDTKTQLRTRSFRNMVGVVRDGEPVNSTLEVARTQTLCINAAHESCPEIHTIPDSFVDTVSSGGDSFRVVEGMDDLVRRGPEEGLLFSEMGAEWAVPSTEFSTEGYVSYPR